MKEFFKNAVRDAHVRRASLVELIQIARVHKDHGLTQDVAYEALEELRTVADEGSEDRLLELMDVISGYCQQRYKIWESTLASR